MQTLNQKGGAPSPLTEASEFAGVGGAGAGIQSQQRPSDPGYEGSRMRVACVTKKERNSRGAAETAAPPAFRLRM